VREFLGLGLGGRGVKELTTLPAWERELGFFEREKGGGRSAAKWVGPGRERGGGGSQINKKKKY